MGYFLLILVAFTFTLTVSNKIFQQEIQNNVSTISRAKFYATQEEKLLLELQSARDNYLEIYNSYPGTIDDLIDSGLLKNDYKNSEFGQRVLIENGTINYTTDDVTMLNLLIVANKKVIEANSFNNSVENLRKQKMIINTIKSNDLEVSNSTNFSEIVKDKNLSLGNLQLEELSKNPKNIEESANKIDNDTLKNLKGF
ncbi:hypothetical protein N5912_02565 [Arcobacter lacus]|uniref:hypothetical protein n=1 Tax=Arcobacter lacus TaxID=1912876 RepID=UPI0021BAC35A|nr:hypothetical protein [Arcobacter lacus]MCT7910702.1 hypothetical protein [Arcobacter lacus]